MRSISTVTASLLAVLAIASPAWAGNGQFAAGQKLPVTLPQTLAVADLNGDGRPDVATPSSTEKLVYVHLRKAGGGFTRAPDVATGGDPSAIAAADVNGDGKVDLAVTSGGDKAVNVRLGDGNGGFAKGTDVAVSAPPVALAVGDFNADGKEDLVIADHDNVGAHVRVELGAGDGTFAAVGSGLDLDATTLVTGDLNADGNEDVVYAGRGNSGAGLLLGKGGGVLDAPISIDFRGAVSPGRGLALGDFDADGNLDVAAAVPAEHYVDVRYGDGKGQFPYDVVPSVGPQPAAIATADLNADGTDDFVVTDTSDHAVRVRLGHASDAFGVAPKVPTGASPTDVAVADFGGDGIDDLAVSSTLTNGGVGIHRGLGTAPLAGNLLANGGFEGAGAAGTGAQSPAIPGWQRTGGMTFARYGMPSHAYFPSPLTSPRFATGGTNLLWGGNSAATAGITTASQTVALTKGFKAIDAGHGRTRLSAYLGGAMSFPDTMTARAAFLGKGGATLGTLAIGPVTAAQRHGLTTLLPRAGARQLPVGTRKVRVTLTSNDADRSYSSAVADNVKLTVLARNAFAADTAVRVPAKAFVNGLEDSASLTIANDNPFRVTGTLRAITVKRFGAQAKRVEFGPFAVAIGPGGTQTLRLKLPAAVRKELLDRPVAISVTAVVRDPAGHERTVAGTAQIVEVA